MHNSNVDMNILRMTGIAYAYEYGSEKSRPDKIFIYFVITNERTFHGVAYKNTASI